MEIRSLIKNAFERRGNPLENPAISLASPALWQWLTGGEPTAAGELINEFTAMQQMTVYACVRILGESVASLPLKLYERLANGRQEATAAPLYDLLAINPNPEMTAFTFFETMTGCLALTGNCYAQIQRNAAGQPIALWPLHPLKTDPKRAGNGELFYETTDGETSGKPRPVASADMVHVPLFCFDGLKGFSPIQLARQGIGLARAAEKFGARFFGNGSRPGGILSTSSNLTDPQKALIKESWASAQGGANQGKTAVLWGDWKYEQIGLSPEDSQFLATRQFQRTDICALFRVPPHMAGDTTRLSNSNHEQQSLQFVTDTLRPYLARFEHEIHRKLMPSTGRNAGRYFVQFDVRERLRGDFQTTMQGYALGKQWGFYSTNMILEELGENPVGPVGDIFWRPVNMVDASLPESPQDPVAAVPPAPAADPTPAERNLLGEYIPALTSLFRDGLGRVCAREKRDSAAIDSIFGPMVRSILNLAGDLDEAATDRLMRDALKALEKRAAAWTAEQADEIAGPEFIRIMRGIVANTGRELGAAAALKQIEGIEK